MERRITAIIAADIVGFSRLIERDEVGVLHRQKTITKSIIKPALNLHHGRVIKTTGDGFLAEFPSVFAAANCAIELQKTILNSQAQIAEGDQISYRMAVHIGDVVADEGDLLGDGVNVVSRLEALAAPGGIVVSDVAYKLLQKQLPVRFVSGGKKQLKNILEPVEIYHISVDGVGDANVADEPSGKLSRRLRLGVYALGLGLLLVGTWFAVTSFPNRQTENDLYNGRTSIVVMPFSDTGSLQGQDYFADGLTHDITTDLSQLPELFVISRASAYSYKSTSAEPRQISQDLGVRFILSGNVRKVEDTIRINLTLVDGTTGGEIWAERFDGETENVLAFQDRVVNRVVSSLPVELDVQQVARSEIGGTKNPLSFDAYLQALHLYDTGTAQSFAEAVPYLEVATKLDPDYGRAYALLALIYFEAWQNYWQAEFGYQTELERRFLKRSSEETLELAKQNPTALAYLVTAQIMRVDGQTNEMFQQAVNALEVEPNSADALYTRALARLLNGETNAALTDIEKAIAANRIYPTYYLTLKGGILFSLERYEEAASVLEVARSREPSSRDALMFNVATLSMLGRSVEAEMREIWRLGERIHIYKTRWRFKNDSDWDRLADALRSAGVSEDY
ncbi:adenylate/guanylate cyclase domain-containing protein [Ruegeria conchae]|uniref:Adenylate cyclase n=1 Tax=Ruegeria conchae TaxID=981384 RepID=A0A497YP11_9RHOB|nr:adenylate/guanylate cyclase domain-containing protein [Ruegeria conchae]RLJ97648.1 adenylate cyclase [Ruegeria conchae]